MLAIVAVLSVFSEGLALEFNGNSIARVADCVALRFRKEFTLEAWVWLDDAVRSRTFACLFSKNLGASGYELTVLDRPNHRLHGTDSGTNQLIKTPVPIGRWVHVGYARSMRRAAFYIDGKLGYQVLTQSEILPNELPLCLGSSNDLIDQEGKPCAFIGKMDEIKIWQVARSERNIRRDMLRVPRVTDPNLIAYFGFDGEPTQRITNPTGKTGPLEMGRTVDEDTSDPKWVDGVQTK